MASHTLRGLLQVPSSGTTGTIGTRTANPPQDPDDALRYEQHSSQKSEFGGRDERTFVRGRCIQFPREEVAVPGNLQLLGGATDSRWVPNVVRRFGMVLLQQGNWHPPLADEDSIGGLDHQQVARASFDPETTDHEAFLNVLCGGLRPVPAMTLRAIATPLLDLSTRLQIRLAPCTKVWNCFRPRQRKAS